MTAVAVVLLVAAAGALVAVPAPEARLRRLPGREGDAPGGARGSLDAAPGVSRRRGRWRGGGFRRGGGRGPDPAAPPVDLVLDLVGAAMRAGAPPGRALALVAAACPGGDGAALATAAARQLLGAGAGEAWDGLPRRLGPVRDALVLSAAAGVPAADLLAAAADDERRLRHRRGRVAAARLGVRLTLPTGLCALPAFVAWGVVPVVLSLAGSASGP